MSTENTPSRVDDASTITPETEKHAFQASWMAHAVVSADFARRLERERNEAKRQAFIAESNASAELGLRMEAERERDAALAERDALRERLREVERDAARLSGIERLRADGVHIEVGYTGSFSGADLVPFATVYAGSKSRTSTSLRASIDAALSALPAQEANTGGPARE